MAVVADPRKLLLPDPEYKRSVLSDKFFPIVAATVGFVAVVGTRYAARRPIFSGIQHHILSILAGGAFGVYGQRQYEAYNSEKDTFYRHYIELHPEDFPVPERKKIGEIFPKFTPIR